jgi:hypothetical protein
MLPHFFELISFYILYSFINHHKFLDRNFCDEINYQLHADFCLRVMSQKKYLL